MGKCFRLPDRMHFPAGRPPVVFITLLLLISIGIFHGVISASGTDGVERLELNKQIDGQVAVGQKQIFEIDVEKDQYAEIEVVEKNFDLKVSISDPELNVVAEQNGSGTVMRTLRPTFIASKTAVYRIEISSRAKVSAAEFSIVLTTRHPATDDDRASQEVEDLNRRISELIASSKAQDAIPLAERALDIRTKTLKLDDPSVAASLNRLGLVNYQVGELTVAEEFLKKSIAIYEKDFGKDDLRVTEPLITLAAIYDDRGEFSQAVETLNRALSILGGELAESTNVARVLNNLGILYREKGEYGKAEESYQRSLSMREGVYGAGSIETAATLGNISTLYYHKGDLTNALQIDEKVLKIMEANRPSDHPDIAHSLNKVALIYADLGDLEKSGPLYERSLAIYERNPGRETVSFSGVEFNYATLMMKKGDFDKAKPLFEHALSVAEKHKEDNPAAFAEFASGFGEANLTAGDYPRAEQLILQALRTRLDYSSDPNEIANLYDLLVELYVLKGDLQKAREFETKAIDLNERNIAINIAVGTEHQKLAYMQDLAESLNQAVVLQSLLPNDTGIAKMTATAILQQKGRVLDALSESMSFLRQRASVNDRVLFDKLNDTNAELSQLEVNGPGDSPTETQKQIESLRIIKDNTEAEISRLTSGYFERSAPVILASIQEAIPFDSALVEFTSFHAIKPKGAADKDMRYGAYVFRDKGPPKWIDIGSCAEIDGLIGKMRSAIRDPKRTDVLVRARELDAKVMQPVRDAAADAKHFLISPEGELSLIPFEALVDQHQQYLVESYAFTYLTSGRDLLRMKTDRNSKSGPSVFADPSFGLPDRDTQIASVGKNGNLARRGKRMKANRRSVTTIRGISDAYFAPLGGSGDEGRAIRSIFPDAKLFVGDTATESAIKQVVAPSILHIATHGFFFDDNAFPQNEHGTNREAVAYANPENPLLRSGLAFAGANRRSNGVDDGILTALEASGLNLWGTKLVVLSACDTGIGEVKTGEGVYGLRRSFVEAGAETLVMSMWPVSDVFTRDLMINYYKYLKSGKGRGEALRLVQLDLLHKPGRQHPFYWASFIQEGEWANLDGHR